MNCAVNKDADCRRRKETRHPRKRSPWSGVVGLVVALFLGPYAAESHCCVRSEAGSCSEGVAKEAPRNTHRLTPEDRCWYRPLHPPASTCLSLDDDVGLDDRVLKEEE